MGGPHGEEAHKVYNGGNGSHMRYSEYFFMFESYDLLHASTI